MRCLVQIHGLYCGPNWTAGRRLPASDPRVDFNVKPVDRLDAACRIHDMDCANPAGCSASADRRLAAQATLNAILRPDQRDVSLAIAATMGLAQLTRKR